MHSNSCFSKTGLTLRSVAKDSRRRYGKLVKAIAKIVDQLLLSSKKSDSTSGSSSTISGINISSPDSVKIASFEEAAARALADVEKAKEKRRENERKIAAAIEEKIKKDFQKEMTRAQKEEIAILEKKEKASEKEKEKDKEKEKEKEKDKKVVTEKEIKQAQELKQQRSMFTGFFKSEPKNSLSSSSSSSSFSGSSSSCVSISTSASSVCTPFATSSRSVTSNRISTVGPSSSSTSSSTSVISSVHTPSSSVICLDGVEIPNTGLGSLELPSGVAFPGFDVASFEQDLKASISMGEICRTMRERWVSS